MNLAVRIGCRVMLQAIQPRRAPCLVVGRECSTCSSKRVIGCGHPGGVFKFRSGDLQNVMGASHKIKIAKLKENGHSDCPDFWSAPPPRIEAIALLQMLRRGATVEEIRELIAIPPEMEQSLREYAAEHPEELRVERELFGL